MPEFVRSLVATGSMTDVRRRELAAYCARIARVCLRHEYLPAGRTLFELADTLDRRGARGAAYGWRSRALLGLMGPVFVERLARLSSRVRRRLQ